MKTIYCISCKIKVAEIFEGSKIKKGAVMLCSNCEIKRIVSDMGKKTENNYSDLFKDIFNIGE